MRSSSVAFVGVVGVVALVSACRVEVHTQTQFEDSSQAPETASKDWSGEPITIENAGINPLGGTGGVEVIVDPAATRISASAVFAARADDDKRSEADESIRDAIATFAIEETVGGFSIKCGHGQAHGTSSVAGSGCKILRVTIPQGSATQPLALTIGNGNGDIRMGLSGSAPFVQRATIDNNGVGDVNVRLAPVASAVVVVTGESKVEVGLPSTFSAAKVSLSVNEDDPQKAAARIITTAFPGMDGNGKPYPTSGATTDAAADLSVSSKGLLDDYTVTLSAF